MGLATYNSEKYIESCLSSLLAQNYENVEVVIFDNNSQDKTVATIRENFSSEKVRIIESTENVGFSRAHNEILRATDSEFYACLNIDMIFEPNFISESVKSINEKPIFGSTGGKIKKWDFDTFKGKGGLSSFGKSGKTNFIDSAGLKIFSSHRFENIGEGEVDYGQFNESKEVFGFSGAAVLYRRKALEDVAFINEKGEKEFFDESMFLYKEDIDLAYRLQWAGW
ncbi:MAG: glycosyltransferase family 2 protein, partial [Candidatus Peregrinibacteria bacterium]|nr:glycosyltransferase family 2 protein [Candidatus Peregrinibacteria bacterium]